MESVNRYFLLCVYVHESDPNVQLRQEALPWKGLIDHPSSCMEFSLVQTSYNICMYKNLVQGMSMALENKNKYQCKCAMPVSVRIVRSKLSIVVTATVRLEEIKHVMLTC